MSGCIQTKPGGKSYMRAERVEHPHGKGAVAVSVPGWGSVPRGTSREKKRPRTALIAEAAQRKIAEREG